MMQIENDCVDCVDIGLHCMGRFCPNYGDKERYYCDDCEKQIKLYKYHNNYRNRKQLCEGCIAELCDEECTAEHCEECIAERYEVVEGSEVE